MQFANTSKPLQARLVLLLQLSRIPLRPLPHGLALNLAARQLGHFVHKDDASHETLVFGDAWGDPILDVLGRDLVL